LSKKELTERDDARIRRRIAERRVLKDAIWFANQPTFDLRAVCERLRVLPPLTRRGPVQIARRGRVQIGPRWHAVGDSGVWHALGDSRIQSARSVQYAQRLHTWWVTFLKSHVEPPASPQAEIAKPVKASRHENDRTLPSKGDVFRVGSDVFARVGFDGKRWLIIDEQPFVTPTLEGFVHYASTLIRNPKLEWSGWLGRCKHQINDGAVCGLFLLKKAVTGPKPDRCPEHQVDQRKAKQAERNRTRKEGAAAVTRKP
jgi:hypothetical protein